MKKYYALVCFAVFWVADLLAAPVELKDGYYVAVAAGYDVYKIKDNVIYTDPVNGDILSINPDLTVNGMIGDFIFGYSKLFGPRSNLYLGIEAFANGSAADSDFQVNVPNIPVIIDTDIVVNGSFGLGVMPGFKINKSSMLYLKFGYNWATLSVDETVRTEHDFILTSTEYNDNPTIHGYMMGIGVESAFYELFSLRAEYSYTMYASFVTRASGTMQPSRNQFLLGLVYRFSSRHNSDNFRNNMEH